jgi:hypothetical protein
LDLARALAPIRDAHPVGVIGVLAAKDTITRW